MPDKTPSVPPAEKGKTARLSLVLGAFTDWLVCVMLGAGIYHGMLPVEPWAYVLCAIGAPSALAGAAKRMTGKGSGSASLTALLAACAGKVGVGGVLKKLIIGAAALLAVGCASALPFAQSALQVIAPIAADLLRKEAERRDVDLDESQAICVPLPDEYQPEGQLVVVCAAPEADE